MANPHTPTMEI